VKDPTIAAAMPRRFNRSGVAKLQQSRAYDALMRLPLLVWSFF